jgi:hypothetical protein
MPQNNSKPYSSMYGGETDDDIDDTPQVNGSLINGINGYEEENDIQSLVCIKLLLLIKLILYIHVHLVIKKIICYMFHLHTGLLNFTREQYWRGGDFFMLR